MIRGKAGALRDHICKEMNPLNLERCKCIPKNQPGADWRVLQQIVAADPTRETVKVNGQPIGELVPWCVRGLVFRNCFFGGGIGRVFGGLSWWWGAA